MEQSDIKELISILTEARETENWELVEEAQSFLDDFLDDKPKSKNDYDD